MIAGSATGAYQEVDVAYAARFCIEAAKDYGSGRAIFFDDEEFSELSRRYGSMEHLQTLGVGGTGR